MITATASITDAHIEVIPQQTGRVDLDMISLFPQKTFKGRKNGLRADLAQALADLNLASFDSQGMCCTWRRYPQHLPMGKHHWAT